MSRRRLIPALIVAAALAPAASAAPPIEQLIGQLASDDWILQAEAVAVLADADPQRARTLFTTIANDRTRHAWLRGRAMIELADLDEPAARDAALALAKSSNTALRLDALSVLGRVGGPGAMTTIEANLRAEEPTVRAGAVAGLARLDPARAWPILETAYPKADARTLPIYAGALALIDHSRARRLIAELLNHDDAVVRRNVIRGLGERGDRPSRRMLMAAAGADESEANRQLARRFLLASDRGDLVALVRAGLRSSSDAEVRAAADLLRAANDLDWTTDVASALPRLEQVGRLPEGLALLVADRPGRFVDTFGAYLDHDSEAVRLLAIDGLAAVDSVDRWQALAGRLDDRSGAVRDRVAALLIEAGAPAKGVMAYLDDPLAGDRQRWDDVRRIMRLMLTEAELHGAAMKLRPWLLGGNRGRREQAFEALGGALTERNAWRVAGALGYLYDWRVIGPFANDEGNGGFGRVYPPERELDFDATYPGDDGHAAAWRDHRAADPGGRVVMHELMPLPSHFRVGYAHAVIDAPEATKARLDVFADDAIKIWLNGEKVAERGKRGGFKVDVELERGANPLLVKIANQKDYWAFRIQLTDRAGRPVDWLVR